MTASVRGVSLSHKRHDETTAKGSASRALLLRGRAVAARFTGATSPVANRSHSVMAHTHQSKTERAQNPSVMRPRKQFQSAKSSSISQTIAAARTSSLATKHSIRPKCAESNSKRPQLAPVQNQTGSVTPVPSASIIRDASKDELQIPARIDVVSPHRLTLNQKPSETSEVTAAGWSLDELARMFADVHT